jgi:ferredoxin--NADP+ reductase
LFQILEKKVLNEQVKLMIIDAPHIAKKAKAGQFIILRVDEKGERIPLTIADYDREKGTVTIIFQEIGKTTKSLGELKEGDYILDFVGPLGVASHLEGLSKVAVIGGGLGCAIAYPQAKALNRLGTEVHLIAGFRNMDLIILEDEMRAVCSKLIVCTDDGSNGNKGLVTDMLKGLLKEGNQYDAVIVIGPLIMMKFVSLLTKEYNIKTIVSMNSTMVDGTGMCGCCRLTVGGETKFACVDGPDFDGHLVDFDEAISRTKMYSDFEKESLEMHNCRLGGVSYG